MESKIEELNEKNLSLIVDNKKLLEEMNENAKYVKTMEGFFYGLISKNIKNTQNSNSIQTQEINKIVNNLQNTKENNKYSIPLPSNLNSKIPFKPELKLKEDSDDIEINEGIDVKNLLINSSTKMLFNQLSPQYSNLISSNFNDSFSNFNHNYSYNSNFLSGFNLNLNEVEPENFFLNNSLTFKKYEKDSDSNNININQNQKKLENDDFEEFLKFD